MDETRTILITTHQVEEVENLLTDVLFIDKGRIVLDASLEDIATRYAAVAVAGDRLEAARAEKPFFERRMLGKSDAVFRAARFRQTRGASARCIRRASPICSSPSCPEAPHEHLRLADTPGILGEPRDLDGARRASARYWSSPRCSARSRSWRRRSPRSRRAVLEPAGSLLAYGVTFFVRHVDLFHLVPAGLPVRATARTAASCSGNPCRYRTPPP